MKTINVSSMYGSTSGNGKTIQLQVNDATGAELISLNIPAEHLSPLVRQLLLLAVQSGEAQAISPKFKMELSTSAVEVPATDIGFAVASPTHTVFLARCGAINVSLPIAHSRVLEVATHLQNLQKER